MPQIKFDSTVSTGNILSILAMMVTVTAGYVTLTNTQETQALSIARLEEGWRGMDGRLRAAELTQAGQASDLRSIQATLQKIDGKLDRLSQQGR
ncbi:hypothetical protein PVT71_13555 [Salipiger sp. H15]|uniref:Uncharacterized protein n=1 Tax=Alloyangia sp. H15 TaxID=3029062 RepID=A0AAU8AGB7_9RHOB